jgi:predicted secreted protein
VIELARRSVGTKLMIGLNAVAGLTSIGAPPKTADTLDTTTLDSDGGYRTFTGGFKDGGEVTISGYFEPGDAGQLALDAAFESGEETDFQIIFPAEFGASWQFRGVVTGFTGGNAELEELLTFEATIKVSGKPVLVTQPSAGLSALSVSGTGGVLSPAFDPATYFYTFDGVTDPSVTVTATAANHTLKLYVDGDFQENLVSGQPSGAILFDAANSRKLTIVANEEGKAPVTYEVIVVHA